MQAPAVRSRGNKGSMSEVVQDLTQEQMVEAGAAFGVIPNNECTLSVIL